jgi:hypothetical protein
MCDITLQEFLHEVSGTLQPGQDVIINDMFEKLFELLKLNTKFNIRLFPPFVTFVFNFCRMKQLHPVYLVMF